MPKRTYSKQRTEMKSRLGERPPFPCISSRKGSLNQLSACATTQHAASATRTQGRVKRPSWTSPSCRLVRMLLCTLMVAAVAIFFITDTAGNWSRFISLLGMLVLIFLGFVFSKHPQKVNWKPVLGGLVIQFICGILILRLNVGRKVINCIGKKISTFLEYTLSGSGFVFGYLVNQKPLDPNRLNKSSISYDVAMDFSTNLVFAPVFYFKVLSIIYYMAFIIAILYYWGMMQWWIIKVGGLLQVCMGTTAAESVATAANIFAGMIEANLLIQPYLSVMTLSELHAAMTAGFATIAGSIMGAYISLGISATHLISASVMSAPAALSFGKLFYPETEVSKTTTDDIKTNTGTEANVLDAATQGASSATILILSIAANLIAFLGFLAFFNGVFSWFGNLIGIEYLSVEFIIGKLFIPLAWLMGVEPDECEIVAVLVGLKTVVNEFVAYERLIHFKKLNRISPRAEAISVYALCGFSNPGAVGILVGALGTMAPSRKGDITTVIFRAYVAGSITCFLTACVAGSLLIEPGFTVFQTVQQNGTEN